MPGVPTLAKDLGIDPKTAGLALRQLEREGLLLGQGPGRPRLVHSGTGEADTPALRIAILDYEPPEQTEEWSIAMQHLLTNQGHKAFFAESSLTQLGMDVKAISSLVNRTAADAWVVCSGSRPVLSWFAEREAPTFALFGRRKGLPIAGVGPNHVAAGRAAVQHLIELGHQRIVVLVRESQRAEGPGDSERAIFDEMAAHGMSTGRYNMPNWEDSADGFHRVLEELFRVTPPSALIIDEPFLFHAAKDHLAQRGVLAPSQVSLICSDPDPTFAWCRPSIAHIRWDHRPVVKRVVRWANNIARGKIDHRQSLTKATFIDGDSVGPAARD